jgi:pimeloyl-ACP methyl ester carboxylesterase
MQTAFGGIPDRKTPLRQTIVTVDGIQTPLLTGGPEDATDAVLCVHGNPGHNGEFIGVGAQLADFTRVLAPDMPGLGLADRPDDFDHSPSGYARFISSLLEESVVDRVHLVLHDFGVVWGLTWAAQNPGRVRSVVVIDGPAESTYRWHFLARLWRTPFLGEAFWALNNRPSSKAISRVGSPRPYPPRFVDDMYDRFDRGMTRAVLAMYRSAHPEEFGTNIEQALFECDIPALIIWGAHDPYVPVAHAAAIKRRVFPSAEVLVLSDSGHWPHIDNPQVVRPTVVRFLRERVVN